MHCTLRSVVVRRKSSSSHFPRLLLLSVSQNGDNGGMGDGEVVVGGGWGVGRGGDSVGRMEV